MRTNLDDFRQFVLDRIEQLDRIYQQSDPHAVVEVGRQYAKVAEQVGNMAARLGHAELYRRSLDFGEFAEWPAVKGFLSECLAAVPEAPKPEHVGETLTADDVARMLGISKRTVWRRREEGTLPATIQIGRLVRWPRAEFEAWLASN